MASLPLKANNLQFVLLIVYNAVSIGGEKAVKSWIQTKSVGANKWGQVKNCENGWVSSQIKKKLPHKQL